MSLYIDSNSVVARIRRAHLGVARFALVGLLVPLAFAQQPRASNAVEVTKTDFTKLERIRATDLATFGVRLGDALAVAQAKVEKANLTWRPDLEDKQRCTIWDQRGKQIAAFDIDAGRVAEIVWWDGMGKYLVGDAPRLFDKTVVDPDSPIRLKLLGRENSHSEQKLLTGRTVTYAYDREGLQIIVVFAAIGDYRSLSIVVHLVQPAKAR